MDSYIVYLALFAIIVLIGQFFQKSAIPIALILVISGMLLSFIPFFPKIQLNSKLILNIFLPFLIYEISAFSSWRDMQKQARPVALLSIGHVLFITGIVAVAIHSLTPQLGWPLAFVLGAIVSPPDDVAIVSIAQRMRIPDRIFVILEGEGMFNDAAALTIFRFALAAAITHQFVISHAILAFFLEITGEALYGLMLGHILGQLRTKIKNTPLHVIASFLTPFIAYIPVIKLGGSGIIATAMVGFIIGNQYALRFTPEYRLTAFSIFPTIGYAIEGIIFLMVGLNLNSTLANISSIHLASLLSYVGIVIAIVIVGRFIWVYGFVIFLPRFLFPSLKKKDPYPSWKFPFIISWSGMRGGIPLAAALAVPVATFQIANVDVRDLFVFIVFSVIFVTLILQGLSLPFIIKKLKLDKIGERERYTEHLTELQTRIQMIDAAMDWLEEYKEEIKQDKKILTEVLMHIYEYKMLKKRFKSRVSDHDGQLLQTHDEEKELREKLSLLSQLIAIEKKELEKIWRKGKISLKTRNKLAATLDHQVQRYLI